MHSLRPNKCATLCGFTFSSHSSLILNSVARARHYTPPHTWVSISVVHLLKLELKGEAGSPVRLDSCRQTTFYYHRLQLNHSESEMRERWAAYKAAHSAAEEVCLAESLGTNDFPLNTNGERFPLTIENEIVSHHNSISNSRYWATVDEAYYLYNVAFHPSYLTPEHRVRVDSNTSKLVYYNVCGTADPSVFNPSTCVRYDPFNYRGKYYHPVTALMMKRFAIANNVLDQKQWASLQLISTMGFTTSKPPLLLVLGDFDVALQNINLTNSPELLASKLGSSPDAEESFEDDILVNGMNPHSDSPDI